MKSLVIVFFALVVHYIFSEIGLLFAIPFGFASSIWPAAGVSLGLYFIFGRPVLLGSFLGYLLATIDTSQSLSLDSVILPALLGLCGVIQLIVIRRIVYMVIPLPIETAMLKNIVKFLFVIGPIGCFVSASMAAVVLAMANSLTWSEGVFTFAIWWVGDWTGVVFFTPLVLFLKSNPVIEKPAQPLKIVISNLIVFAFISLLFNFSTDKYHDQNKREFVQKSQLFVKQFETAQNSIEQQLLALAGLMQSSANINRSDFANFSKKISDNGITLRALAWIPHIKHEERENYVTRMREDGFAQFDIKYLSSSGFKTSPQNNYYFPITFTAPLKPNLAAVGLDLNTHPSVKDVIKQAIVMDDFIVTATLPLVQQQDKYTGVIVYYPVFELGYLDYDRQPMQQLLGLVEAVFELDVLLKNLPAANQSDYAFEFVYGEASEYRSKGFDLNSLFTHTVVVDVFDKKGSLTFTSLPGFDNNLVDWASWLVVVGGTLVGVVSIIFLYSLTSFSANLALQVDKKTKELQESNEKLQTANMAKTMFLANMSHEYRTPLNAIIGFTEIGQRESSDEVAKGYFKKIESSSEMMLGIVNDVLDISKIQTNEFELESEPFSPYLAMNSVIDMLREGALKKGLDFKVDIEAVKNIWVKGDKLRFEQVVVNVLSNAIKFTNSGFVKLQAVVLEDNHSRCQLQLLISDTGLGIDQEKQALIFKPFEQAEDRSNRRFEGTGLGLSIVNELCQLMYGSISVTSEIGQGSTFNIQLMFSRIPEPKDTSTFVEASSQESLANFKSKTVLIVEDNLVNQEVAKRQVASLGANVAVVNNGQECLDYLVENTPDLILMDLQMPVLDGFMTTERIRQDSQWSKIPVVILSASVNSEDQIEAEKLGIETYLTKPFVRKDLINVFNKLFDV